MNHRIGAIVLLSRALAPPADCRHIRVHPWPDPTLDGAGHDPRSAYVERFWLSLLGPSATLFVRYLADRFDLAPEGFELDLADCAQTLGLGGVTNQRGGPAFPRTLRRCCQFHLARLVDPTTLEVRRTLPSLSRNQLRQLPDSLRQAHRLLLVAG